MCQVAIALDCAVTACVSMVKFGVCETGSAGVLPDRLDWVPCHEWIRRENHEILRHSLGDEQTVEGVAMVDWQLGDARCVAKAYG